MFNKHDYQTQRATKLARARQILDGTKAADGRIVRDLEQAEAAEVESLIGDVGRLDADYEQSKNDDRLRAGDAIIAALKGLPAAADQADDSRTGKADLIEAIATKSSRQVTISRKALDTSGMTPIPTLRPDAIGAPAGTAATALRDLFPTETIDTPTVRYYTIDTPTGDFAIVPEGGLKPELDFNYTPHDGTLQKLAARFTTTTEFVDDAKVVADGILKQALLALVRRENKLVLDTMNAATGVVTSTGPESAALDLIAAAIGAQESVNGLRPDAVVMNPADLAEMRLLKSTGSGEYLFGDPLAAGPATAWGLPVVSTPALTAGIVWLIRRDAGVFYERSGVQITAGHTGDDLIYNRYTTIVEERVLPVITQPMLLSKITLTTA